MREGVPPVAECVSAFLDDLAMEGKSPATLHAYRMQLQHLTAWPTEPVCRQLILDRLKVSPSTARLCRAALSSFITYCQHQGWMFESPLDKVPSVKVKTPPHRYLTADQVRAVYAACLDDEERLMVRLLLSGLRASELLSLTAASVSGDVLTVKGKGGGYRKLPLDPDTLALLPQGRFVPLEYRTLLNHVRALGKRAGVPWLRPHDFRRTMSTLWMLETDDMATLQTLGGWKDLEMPRRYARSALEASAVSKARAVDLTHRLLDAP